MKITNLPRIRPVFCTSIALLATVANPVLAQKSAVPVPISPLTYADTADLALASRIAAQIKIRNADALKAEQSPGLLPGRKRYLIVADMVSLIRGEGGVLPRITFLADIAPDGRGKFPKLAKAQMLVFAVPTPARPSEVRLVSPDALTPATPDALARVRSILSLANTNGAPPAITSITDVYHVAGAVAGEGETQIFLQTKSGLPVSVSVMRAMGQAPAWSVALGELVDQAAPPPARDTLLWYRLACFLPRALPPETLSDMDASTAEAARKDYFLVLSGLGTCPRTLRVRP